MLRGPKWRNCTSRPKWKPGGIQFRLRIDGKNWQMPETMLVANPKSPRLLMRDDGTPLERSLFTPVYEAELNGEEQAVACYLDKDDALRWWHRNVSTAHYGYSVQGWRRAMVYPDFVFAVRRDGKGDRVTVLETKGDQLDDLDTAYKRDLMGYLTTRFEWDQTAPAGTLELVQANGETVECVLILMSDWKSKLPDYLNAHG